MDSPYELTPVSHDHRLSRLYQMLWRQGDTLNQEIFETRTIEYQRIGEDGLVDVDSSMQEFEFTVMKLHPFSFDPDLKYILIREDYDVMLQKIETHHLEVERGGGTIITGQPGIGKTLLLVYILFKKLLAGEPVLFQQFGPQRIFIFCDTGVFTYPSDLAELAETRGFSRAIALIDSNDEINTPPNCIKLPSPIFVVQTPSPAQERRRWSKEKKHVVTHVMQPWSWPEILAGNTLLRNPIDGDKLLEVYRKFGPTARLCYAASKIGEWEGAIHTYCMSATLDTIRTAFFPLDRQTAAVSHKAFLLRPTNIADRTGEAYDIITPYVAKILLEHWTRKQDRETGEFLAHLAAGNQSRNLAGVVFEAEMHRILQDGGKFELRPMILQPRRRGGGYNFKINAEASSTRVEYLTRQEVIFQSGVDFMPPNPKRYYHPAATNNASFDAFVVDAGTNRVTLFQMTLAKSHDIKSIGLENLQEHLDPACRASKRKPWKFIFVIPDDQDVVAWTDTLKWAEKLSVYVMHARPFGGLRQYLQDRIGD